MHRCCRLSPLLSCLRAAVACLVKRAAEAKLSRDGAQKLSYCHLALLGRVSLSSTVTCSFTETTRQPPIAFRYRTAIIIQLLSLVSAPAPECCVTPSLVSQTMRCVSASAPGLNQTCTYATSPLIEPVLHLRSPLTRGSRLSLYFEMVHPRIRLQKFS